MNENLQRRIQNLMGNESMPMQMQMGGEVEQTMPEMMPPQADNSALESAINELMMARDTAEDPFEAEKAQQLAEATALSAEAPLATIAQEVMSAGRGDDTTLAHLQPGEVVLPPEMFDDPQFEMAVESRFNELDLDPERYVVGMGIASLNPSTGLEEFGFFKKVGKFFKKVVKKVAPVAMLIPGVGTAVGAALGGIGGLAGTALGKVGLGGLAKGIGSIASPLLSGVSKLGIPGLSNIAGAIGQTGALADQDMLQAMQKAGVTIDQFDKINQSLGGNASIAEIYSVVSGQNSAVADAFTKTNPLSTILQAEQQYKQRVADGTIDPQQTSMASFLSGSGLGNLGGLGGLGIAGLLGKLAYDEAKNRRGVPLTPMTQMDAMGRFNIEAEIARRMGQEAPNPVEFGLMPANTIPQLSGGRPEEPPGMYMGGPVMAFAEGGNVSDEDFKRKTGKINGPGTETSDDIPAMLSDGEFVFKSQSVRGAGAFDMNKKRGGIIELVPNKEESRKRGTDLMYEMMDLFSSYAKKRA